MNLAVTRRIADGGLGFEFYVFVAGSQAFLISIFVGGRESLKLKKNSPRRFVGLEFFLFGVWLRIMPLKAVNPWPQMVKGDLTYRWVTWQH